MSAWIFFVLVLSGSSIDAPDPEVCAAWAESYAGVCVEERSA